MGLEKNGGNFPSQTEYRETAVFSCSGGVTKRYTEVPLCACSALTLFPRPPLLVSVGDELVSQGDFWSRQAQLMFSFPMFLK